MVVPASASELLAGILMGPTILPGVVSSAIFPVDVRPFLAGPANLGLAFFMFTVGLEVDRTLLRGKGRLVSPSRSDR